MSIFTAILLGVVQGITEFLPVSSDGHLVLTQKLLGFVNPPVFFDVLLHIATLGAIIVFFRHEILSLNRRLSLFILLATLPTGVIGLFLNQYIDTLFNSLVAASAGFGVTSLLLLSLTKLSPASSRSKLTPVKAIIIGAAQGLAVLPGLSRSGSTIVTSLWLGLPRQQAFAFSFLISIPAILGAQLVQLVDRRDSLSLFPPTTYLAGFTAAAVVGLISLKILSHVVKSQKLYYFGYYTLPLAIVTWWLASFIP